MQIYAAVVAFFAFISAALYTDLSVINLPLSAPERIEKRATIMFGGDMMFDRHIRKMMQIHGEDHIFSCIKDVLATPDLVVANLEGPVTSNASISLGSIVGTPENFTFTFPPETVGLLKRHNIDLVNIGNNHIMNFGRDGLLETREYLRAGEIAYFGDPAQSEADRVARIELNGIQFAFVNWSDWTSDNTDHTAAQIAEEHAMGRTVVVYTHWGEEYVPPTERVRRLAHSFVDAGASIVIGSHPHIVQEREDYRGVPIYYSLGNLVFDQYWEDAVRTGLLIEVDFVDGKVGGIRELPTYLERDGRVCLEISAQ